MPAAFAEYNRIGIETTGNSIITGSGINNSITPYINGIVTAAADKGGFAAIVV